MMSCGKCGAPYSYINGHQICEKCRILIPSSKEAIEKDIKGTRDIRNKKQQYLHSLLQKHLDSPNNTIPEENKEIELWEELHQIITDLKYHKSYYDDNTKRREFIYPLLYKYIKIAEEIKELYSDKTFLN